jgi:GTP pyrophosphokinase
MPKDATVLDFAFEIHTSLAYQCIGAKIGRNVVPLNHVLHSGDIVEILNSGTQRPSEKWYQFITTTKARKGLNKIFKGEQKIQVDAGRHTFKLLVNKNNLLVDNKVIKEIFKHYQLESKRDLYYKIGDGKIDKDDLETVLKAKATDRLIKYWKIQFLDKETNEKIGKLIGSLDVDEIKLQSYVVIAKCCNPLPGDQIVGCENTDGKIVLHKFDCSVLKNSKENMCRKTIKAHWTPKELLSQLCRIELSGKDRTGIANQVTSLISSELDINIKSLHFDTKKKIFYGMVDVYIANEEAADELVTKLSKLDGITSVKRIKNFKSADKNNLLENLNSRE